MSLRSTRASAAAALALLLQTGCEPAATIDSWNGIGTLVIEGATVFTGPGVEPIQNGIVIVVDGVIEAIGVVGEVPVPPADMIIDGTDLSVIAGFWNSFVRIDDDLLALAPTASANELFALVQERYTRFGFTSLVDVSTPIEALSPLIDRIQSGEVPGPRILGADRIVSAPVSFPSRGAERSVELFTQLAMEDVGVVPGLGFEDEPVASLVGFLDLGGRLLFGTGAGYLPRHDPMPDHLLLDELGVPFATHLASLTTEPARRFGFDYAGEIAPGRVADLVFLEGDPEVDVTAFGRVRLVLREGRPLFW